MLITNFKVCTHYILDCWHYITLGDTVILMYKIEKNWHIYTFRHTTSRRKINLVKLEMRMFQKRVVIQLSMHNYNTKFSKIPCH